MRNWQEAAEEMKRKNLLRRGHLLTAAQKVRYRRKAYRLLMELYAEQYWASALNRDRASPGVRVVRARIRRHCEHKAVELITPATTVRQHREVIKDLQAQVEEKRRQAREAFKAYQPERAQQPQPRPQRETSEEEAEAERQREKRIQRAERKKQALLAVDKRIRDLKREVREREAAHAATP